MASGRAWKQKAAVKLSIDAEEREERFCLPDQ